MHLRFFLIIIRLVYFRMIIFKRRTYLNQLLVDCYLKEVIVDGLYFEITVFFIFSKIIFEPKKFNKKIHSSSSILSLLQNSIILKIKTTTYREWKMQCDYRSLIEIGNYLWKLESARKGQNRLFVLHRRSRREN